MSYKTGFSLKEKYLYVSVSGNQTLQNNIKLVGTCLTACKKNSIDRILIDFTKVTGQPGTFADYELAKIINTWESAKFISMAALVEKEEELPAGKFFETAARNRGINLYVFSDFKKAEEWLNS
jgi:hypothetical protein